MAPFLVLSVSEPVAERLNGNWEVPGATSAKNHPEFLQKSAQRLLVLLLDDTKTVLPVEIARGTYIEHPPSAQALKLLHLMISKAGGSMAEDRHHELKARDFRVLKGMRKHDKASLVPLFTLVRLCSTCVLNIRSC